MDEKCFCLPQNELERDKYISVTQVKQKHSRHFLLLLLFFYFQDVIIYPSQCHSYLLWLK